jgi:hypothetical protein
LLHALIWALVAWLAWACAFLMEGTNDSGLDPIRYCALCLTGCAGVAVLGARRPVYIAWNLVVLFLFAVMVWPLVETLLIGTHPVDVLRIVFMAATIAVGILNYLPTSLGPAALVLLVACAGEITHLYLPDQLGDVRLFDFALTLTPWLAWLGWRRGSDATEFDRRWLAFRDAWGLVWSQRVREQFNNAAHNTAHLAWRGLRGAEAQDQDKLLELLHATLQRFVDQR